MPKCHDCGLEYGGTGWIEVVIPDKVWNKIKPGGCSDGCGLLCVSCIAKRLRNAGFKDVPVWLCGTEPLRAMSGDPSENLELLRDWDVYS